ncbi:PhzF family phenazine biosynthesis protein [Pseudorhodoferax sp.]|uniref:PhzF family phenazine biosynthesis protein n=1 Tax=Pseudorhodoferax sp. TaxID=1993553 RepID=UPI0039E3F46F
MKNRPFRQLDVFTDQPYLGNPLAVVLDGTDLDDGAMQRFAQWTNLSETTFVLPATAPEADYRLRIFTPGGELPFAGHPTLGSCHAWLAAGGRPRGGDAIVQQCGAGLVRIRREDGRLAFAAPPLRRAAPRPAELAQVAAALGLKAAQVVSSQVLDNGPVWFSLLLDDPSTVLRLRPDHAALKALGHKVGVAALDGAAAVPLVARGNREARAFGPAAAAADTPALVVRAFAAAIGVPEDPVTGSLNASLAQWLLADGQLAAPYVAAQGACLGRDGLVHVARDATGQVWIGGHSVACIEGEVRL